MKAYLSIILLVITGLIARAELSAPDNMLYGTISLTGVPVTAANTNVTVEARRTVNGPPIASYQMGSNPDAAAFYALKIPLEEQAPLDRPSTSSLVSNSLFIVVRSSSTDRGQSTYAIPERGRITRLDFDISPPAPLADSDGDGMPDAWELANFGGLSPGANDDWDHDGKSNLAEYIAGTNPMSATGPFTLIITKPAGIKTVSFFAISTAGVSSYEGSTRHYAIESAPNLVTGPWTPVPSYSDIMGNNSTVAYPTQEPNAAYYYRGKVWLTRP